jgi:2-succinyl-5-enolpyruvyl-6-hydroxy-3-cyclohexene-1-carboxylate synthase
VAQASTARQREAGAQGHRHATSSTNECDIYTHHIATPSGLDFALAGALYGFDHNRVANISDFREALTHAILAPRSTILEVRTRRQENVEFHRRIWDAVARAVVGPP